MCPEQDAPPRVAAAVGGQRQPQPAPAARPRPAESRSRFTASLRIGQIACWQVALTLIGLTVGRPWPVAGPAAACAVTLLALTGLRSRGRWLYQWAFCYARFRIRARDRYLPREDGPRALLHLFAPDAMLTSIRLGEGDGDAVAVSRARGVTAMLRLEPAGEDPVGILPRPGRLLRDVDEPSAWGVQLVFHGVAGDRRTPLGWIAVQAVRTPRLSEEDEIIEALSGAVRRVRSRLAERDVSVAGLDQAGLLATVASLAHVSGDRGEVRERWRCWRCGPVAQAGFRLGGWAALPDAESRGLLRQLLTVTTGAVVTVAVVADATEGEPGTEAATMRVAASSVEQLELAVAALDRLAAERDVRLDRMDGEHVDGVAACLPLGVPH